MVELLQPLGLHGRVVQGAPRWRRRLGESGEVDSRYLGDRAGLKVLRHPDAGPTLRFVAAAHEVVDRMIDAPWSEVLRALETLRYAVGSREWDDEADG